MASSTISNYLKLLQDDPGSQAAIDGIREIIASGDKTRMGEQPVRQLEMARQIYESSGEIWTLAKLIELEIELEKEDVTLIAALYKELGRLRLDELLDADAALEAYNKALELNAADQEVAQAIKKIQQNESSWSKFVERYIEEAVTASDISLKTSLLVRAASLTWQYKKKGRAKETDKLFNRALELDPANSAAVQLYEQTLRAREKWDEVVQLLLATGRENIGPGAARQFVLKSGPSAGASAGR